MLFTLHTLFVVGVVMVSALPALVSADNDSAVVVNAKLAAQACASVRSRVNFQLCVDDVMEASDLGMATFWAYTDGPGDDEEDLTRIQTHGDLLVQARKACALVSTSSDFELCVSDVMEAHNLGLAELWPKQPTETEQQRLVQNARVACAKVVTGTGFEACLGDVLTTNDLRFADVWSRTEERQQQQQHRRLRGGSSHVLSRLASFF
mmetsp:Transcript_191/g.329  ORF Transcript_191/g.329 Transcript_191/m.329 type:complete len:207 (+) Transcript_191:110-730(+)|eukprot:scaffold294_cov221-Amphora_coffeaeformis.AAC.12